MAHPLLTRANTCTDGVRIALEADTRERRIDVLTRARRAAQSLVDDIADEIAHLTKPSNG